MFYTSPNNLKQNCSLCLNLDQCEPHIYNREWKHMFFKSLKIFDTMAFAYKDFFMTFYITHTLWKSSVDIVILMLHCRWTVCNILDVILECFPQGFTGWCETGLKSPTFYWSNWNSGTISKILWEKPEEVPLPGCENSESWP